MKKSTAYFPSHFKNNRRGHTQFLPELKKRDPKRTLQLKKVPGTTYKMDQGGKD
jgi:hypothetical protein